MKNKQIIAGAAVLALLSLGVNSAAQAKSHLPYPYNDRAANAQAVQWWTNQQIYGNPLGPGYASGYNPYTNPYASYSSYGNPYANPYVNQYANPYANVNPYLSPYGSSLYNGYF